MRYANRTTAGQHLGRILAAEHRPGRTVVVAATSAAVQLAAEVSTALQAPLYLLLVAKVRHPYDQNRTIGAFTTGRLPVFADPLPPGLDPSQLDKELAYARTQLRINELLYRPFAREALDLQGKTVILVDDGVETGLTMLAVARAAAEYTPKRLIAAVTVASPAGSEVLRPYVSKVIALERPRFFDGHLGRYYRDYYQPDILTVRRLLKQVYHRTGWVQPGPMEAGEVLWTRRLP